VLLRAARAGPRAQMGQQRTIPVSTTRQVSRRHNGEGARLCIMDGRFYLGKGGLGGLWADDQGGRAGDQGGALLYYLPRGQGPSFPPP
jgi:hypothetical protein